MILFQIMSTTKVSKIGISQITAAENMVVLGIKNDIHCFEITEGNELGLFYKDNYFEVRNTSKAYFFIIELKKILVGHTNRVCGIKLSTCAILVSSGYDGVIKIWDMKTFECLANYNSGMPGFSARFLPGSNEKIVVFGGKDSTVITFDWTKYTGEIAPSDSSIIKNTHKVEWASSAEVITTIRNKRKKQKINLQNVDNGVESIIKNIEDITLENGNDSRNTRTLFPLTAKELSANPLKVLENMLKDNEELSFSQRMFGGREIVRQLIEEECKLNVKYFFIK